MALSGGPKASRARRTGSDLVAISDLMAASTATPQATTATGSDVVAISDLMAAITATPRATTATGSDVVAISDLIAAGEAG